MVDVADDDVEVGVFGVVEVVDIAAFDKERVLPGIHIPARAFLHLPAIRQQALRLAEGGDIARLDVDDAVIPIAPPEKPGDDLRRLPGLHQLAGDETGALAVRERRIARQAAILFVADEAALFQSCPERAHILAHVLGERVVVFFRGVQLAPDQHAVVEAVVLDDALRIDVVNIVIRRQTRKVDRIAAVHALAHLREVEVELVTA